jgi:methionyl-tRNA synthetase
MSAGVELPKRVFAHGFLFNKGEKMSKSVGNVVDPFALIDAYGLDQVRYFFMREVPFGNDGSYSHEAIVNRINADLANGLGNLAQRSLSMIAKHCEGKVPGHGAFTTEDEALLATGAPALAAARDAMDRQAIHKAIEATFEIVAAADRYIDAQAPWALRKTDPDRMRTVLYVVAETVRRIAILARPYMPEATGKLLDLVAAPADARDFASLDKMLVPGTELPAPSGVFPRYVEKEAES